MATSSQSATALDFDMVDLSEGDKAAAQKYLSENGIRGLEGFLAERLDAWRKWFVYFWIDLLLSDDSYCFSPLNIAITGDSGAVSIGRVINQMNWNIFIR